MMTICQQTCNGCQHLNLDKDTPTCGKGHTINITADLRCQRGVRVTPASVVCLQKEWKKP
jgi:hypothetical protein